MMVVSRSVGDIDLRAHLASYSIQHFDDNSYWDWARSTLGPAREQELEKLRRPIAEYRANEKQLLRFYDHIAQPTIAGVVHSMKADAIRASGEFVRSRIPPTERILDIGCGIGYLTTYYAMTYSACTIIGCDVSKKSIETARAEAAKRHADFIACFSVVGLALEHFEFRYYSDRGKPGAYPSFHFVKGGIPIELDVFAEYEIVRRRLAAKS